MAAKRIKLSVGDQVMIVGDDRTGEALRGRQAEVVRRKGCPPGFTYVNVAFIGERYIHNERLQPIKETA